MIKKNTFLALFALVTVIFQVSPAQAKSIQLNEKTNFLRIVMPESEAKQAVISYLSTSFMDNDIDVKDLYSGQWIKLEVFDANDKIPPFTQLPVLFSARKEDSLFYIKIEENPQFDITTSLKLLNSSKIFFLDDQMSHEASLVIKASPSASLSVLTKPLSPNDFTLPPIVIGENPKDFSMNKTLYIQLIITKN